MSSSNLKQLSFARDVLSRHLKVPDNSTDVIKKMIIEIGTDPRIPRLNDALAALKTVVRQLMKEFPKQGYENWRPPTSDEEINQNCGRLWSDAVKSLHSYYDSTGKRL